ncbi:MAG: hypothetical protein E7602_03180 [Ruminococcaceae bacterium]|nr:hypothetical protein [Oscillospiraceae bacterium]
MANESITAKIEGLNKVLKFFIFFLVGGIMSPLYRVFRYLETKNTVTLVVAIVSFVFGLSWVLGIVDAITELTSDKVTVLAD